MDENFRMHWARERARRASLAAMGITPFVSRFDAPGAKRVSVLTYQMRDYLSRHLPGRG